ncbi:hypothetical protein Sulfitobl28_14490 [Sulfitobacter pontiacus]|nr:hypothetical protein Sulfitobl28_14490 [Sulfitobacter pontiacus]
MDDALSAEAAMVQERPGRLREFWFYFRENRGAVIGLWIFAVFAFLALFGPWVAPHDATEQFRAATLQPPRGKRAAAGPISWVPIRSGAICCRV